MHRNVHERLIPAPVEHVGRLLDTLGSAEDRVWPLPPRAPMVIRHPGGHGLAVGATGGHGMVRYAVEEFEPGRRVLFRFAAGMPMRGTHAFTVEAAPGGSVVRHELASEAAGLLMRVLGPLVVRRMHDCYVEDAFDRIERALGVGPAAEHRHSRWMGILEPRLRRRVTPTAPVLTGLGAKALERVDAGDAFRTDLIPGDGLDPVAWSTAIFAAVPWWVRTLMRVRQILMRPFGVVVKPANSAAMFPLHAVTATEALLGIDDKHLDFRVIATVDEAGASMTVTTVVRVHSVLGRLYWAVVKHFHPLVVRSLMRHTAHPAGIEAAYDVPLATTAEAHA